MEKTLTINISGWVFNINEDAYKKLTDYFVKLKKHFSKQEGGDEIVADIESRIAELFKEQNKDKESVIDLMDVEKVMNIMGQADEMEEDMDETDQNLNKGKNKQRKKLFRDPIHAHLGGVASGLGKYLNIDPIIIRILFIATIFTGGIGVFAYLVLWVSIPEASTTSERIEMEGKKVTVQNIEEKVREEAAYIGGRLSEFSVEAKDVYHKTKPVRRQGLKKIENIFKIIGRALLRVSKFILGLLLFLTGATALAFFAIFYFNWLPGMEFDTFFVNGLSLPEFLNTFIFDSKYSVFALIALSISIFIPIVMLVFIGIRFMFNVKRNKQFGNIVWQVWLVTLIVSFGLSYNTIRDFKSDATKIMSYNFNEVSSDTLNIKLNTIGYYRDIVDENSQEVIGQDILFPILHDGELYGIPELTIRAGVKDHFEMKVYIEASGKDEEEANNNIEKLIYQFSIDSTAILLDPYFGLQNNKNWRDQEIRIELLIPEGKSIAVDRNIRKHFDLPYYWTKKLNENKLDISFWKVQNEDFIKIEADTIIIE